MLPTVMNPTSADPTAPPPPPPPRSSFSCDRHPAEHFTGFCPSCLCERLTTLDNSSSNTPSSSRRPSSASAAAAIKALFSSSTLKPTNFAPPPPPPKQLPSFPELRRTKSFSASKNEALGQIFEPQRKSCDVRVRNTLWTLFALDDESKGCGGGESSFSGAAASSSRQNSKKTASFDKPVLEETENLESGNDFICDVEDDPGGSEIRSARDSHLENSRNAVELKDEIAGEATAREVNLKIKDHIDGDSNQEKKRSGFWAAASVFSKKWHKWRLNHKTKKTTRNTLPVEKPISRQYRETQSEIADYGHGRRSCDTDPRFSVDDAAAAARCSFEEPRASWDGYLMGRSFPRMEIPGGTLQTREYYSDSSCRRRKSVDRCSSSSSMRKSVVEEMDELKMISNAKVSPTTADCYHGARELRNEYSNSNSLIGNGERKEEINKARKWSWRKWGFTHRRNNDEEEEYNSSRINGVGRSMSVRSEVNVNSRNGGSMRKFERNRSARYVENGLYGTPMGGSRRLANEINHKRSNSIATSVLRLY